MGIQGNKLQCEMQRQCRGASGLLGKALRTLVLYAHTVADVSNHSCGPCNVESSNRPMLLWGRPGNGRDSRCASSINQNSSTSTRNLTASTESKHRGSLLQTSRGADARATSGGCVFAGINGGHQYVTLPGQHPMEVDFMLQSWLMATLIVNSTVTQVSQTTSQTTLRTFAPENTIL
jgi:hypothetical protein